MTPELDDVLQRKVHAYENDNCVTVTIGRKVVKILWFLCAQFKSCDPRTYDSHSYTTGEDFSVRSNNYNYVEV